MIALAAAVLVAATPVRIGSKAFTESVLLAEIAAAVVRAGGTPAEHVRELGGSAVVWRALLAGAIDVYPEYTGTLRLELLAAEHVDTDAELRPALARHGVRLLAPLGFDNTYGLGVRRETAASLGLARISDLARQPHLRYGLSNEFLERRDGWHGLRDRYGLAATNLRGMQHALAYAALRDRAIDVVDVYTTDPEIARDDVVVLADDRRYFPVYMAVLLVRDGLAPGVIAHLEQLSGHIDTGSMRALNARAQLDGAPPETVAADYVRSLGIAASAPEVPHRWARLQRNLVRHLELVGVSLLAAIIAAVPLGVACARWRRLATPALAVASVLQTIPSLALLVLMIPVLGIGYAPAVAALFLYSLLPIVQNTFTGLRFIPTPLRESAAALGLSARTRLFRIELPLAAPAILAGVRTAAVINVGTATLGALVGAGGLGEPILTGVRLSDVGLVLEGAVPAALLALLIPALFDLLGWLLVPRSLRRKGSPSSDPGR